MEKCDFCSENLVFKMKSEYKKYKKVLKQSELNEKDQSTGNVANMKKKNWARDSEEYEKGIMKMWKLNGKQPPPKLKLESFNKNSLDITRIPDANSEDPSSSSVTSVHFHPSNLLMLASGCDKFLRLFCYQGREFRKQQRFFFDKTPMNKARFNFDGSKIILAGGRNLYSLDVCSSHTEKIASKANQRFENSTISFVESQYADMIAITGKKAIVSLISVQYGSQIASLAVKNTTDVSFASNGLHIFTTGDDGIVCCWDIRTQRCYDRFKLYGGSTFISASPDQKHLVAGFSHGLVQIFADFQERKPSVSKNELKCHEMIPTKEISSLTTEISDLTFSKDGQLLAISSQKRKNSLRLIHLPSYNIISNWPSNKTPLNYVFSTAFSYDNKYLAIGNARGRVLLYHISSN